VPGPDAERILQAVERLKQNDERASHPPQQPQQHVSPNKDKEELDDEAALVVAADAGEVAPMQIEEADLDEQQLFFNKQKEVPASTKLSVLVHFLEDMVSTEPESKVLVFSQFTTFLDLIEACLVRSDALGAAYCRLDGKMKLSDRSNEIESFKSDPVCCLLCASFARLICHSRSPSAFSCCRSRWRVSA
jgi:SNF2 family DNA or RNA helicase